MWIVRTCSKQLRQIRQGALGEYQASLASHSSLRFVIFTTSANASRAGELCLMIPQYCKTYFFNFLNGQSSINAGFLFCLRFCFFFLFLFLFCFVCFFLRFFFFRLGFFLGGAANYHLWLGNLMKTNWLVRAIGQIKGSNCTPSLKKNF